MPYLYLSPSTQEFNPYVTTGNEEYWMNQLADRMEPYLLASGVGFVRNDPQGNAASAIALLDKKVRHDPDLTPDYVGFQCPDHFVVGYGLDYSNNYRNLPYIAILNREVYK